MATICCPKSIKACAMRITRQDDCNIALDPLTPNSRVLTSGFMELNLSPDVEAGEDITMKNACGEICIRDKDCDRLKGFEVELKLCGVPLPIIEMLIDATLLEDGEGNIVGAATRNSLTDPCQNSKMLELWSKNAEAVCTPGGAGSDQPLWIQWVLPLTRNWEISGGMNFTTGALEVAISGYSENNPNWFPSFPGATFPAYDGNGNPIDPAPCILPDGITADPWSLTDQTAIQQGGPIAWRCVGSLPGPVNDCAYMPSEPASA